MTHPTILLSPIKPAISAKGGTFDIMVRVQAPDKPAQITVQITPKRLALVVDRSGSMEGRPLTEALRCVAHIAQCLTPIDQLAVVVYDQSADVLLPLAPVTSPITVHQAIANVVSGGATNLFDGWQAGAKQLASGQDGCISRVILLSDGQANRGLIEVSDIAKHCRELQANGVSTTTVGLGRHFNEDLMIAMARAGGGQQYYGQRAADLFDSFDEEFQLLQALCLRRLDISFTPAPGVIIEPLGLVQQNPNGSYRLSDLAWGAESWIMLRLYVSPSAADSTRSLLAASLQASTLDGQTITAQSDMLALPVVDDAQWQTLPSDTVVHDRQQELEFANASQALNGLVQSGDLQGVRNLLADLERQFGLHPWLHDKVQHLRTLAERDIKMMSKEVQYSSMKMSSRLQSRDETRYRGDETNEVSAVLPSFLRKKAQEGKGRSQPPVADHPPKTTINSDLAP